MYFNRDGVGQRKKKRKGKKKGKRQAVMLILRSDM